MYSNKFEYGQRRPYNSRDSRSWDEETRRGDWKEPQRNSIQDPHDSYIADGHNRGGRVSNRDYSESHNRGHSPDLKRDWRRKSPVRKRMQSPERGVSEKRRRTLADEDNYRYQHESEESCRQPPVHYTHSQRNKDFKCTVPLGESYSLKRTPEESRYSHHQDELPYRHYQDEPNYRRSPEYYTDRENRESRERSQERMRSREVVIKNFTPHRQRSDSFEEHNHNRTRFSMNGSSQQTGEPSDRCPSPAAAGEKKLSKGFQRFLDVLNMGVNVETLTKIVTQGPPDVNFRPHSPPSSNTSGKPWSVVSPQVERRDSENTQYWPVAERTERPAYPESSPFERKLSDSQTISPSMLVKETLSPEEDHKRKQMQDVLQAIGINLEYEELGQMSSRIQERLYGKKQNDGTLNPRDEKERRRPYIPKRRSRSSSRSSSSPSFQDYHNKSHSYSAQRDETDFSQTDRCGTQQSTTNPSAAIQLVSPATHAPKPEPPPCSAPSSNLMLNYSPYTQLPPNIPSIMPNLFMPRVPPYLPYPQTPPPIAPINMFPPIVPQSRPLLPPQLNFPPHPFLNLPSMYPTQPVNTNTQKVNKNPNRPRCLQVISTKEHG